MRERFEAVADHLTSLAHGDEHLAASYRREESDFVRLNQAAVRQAGSVTQHHLSFDLIEGRRHAGASLAISGNRAMDDARGFGTADSTSDFTATRLG